MVIINNIISLSPPSKTRAIASRVKAERVILDFPLPSILFIIALAKHSNFVVLLTVSQFHWSLPSLGQLYVFYTSYLEKSRAISNRVTVAFLDGNLHSYQACDPRLISIDDALFLSRNHDYLKLWASIYDTQTHGDISQVCGSIVAEKVIEAYGNLNVTALFEAFDITPLFRNYGTTATPTPTSTVTKEEPGDTK